MNCIGTKRILEILKHGGTGVIPTDTIYGVVASAWSEKAVERVYKVLKRNSKKPFIILISSIGDLSLFNIKLDNDIRNIIKKLWPGKVSIILPVISKKFQYLHRGAKTLAFRVPKKPSLIKILKKTGPLVSTSTNPEGRKPAETIVEARKYFGNLVDFYVNGSKLSSKPSTLLKVGDGKASIIRQGAFKVSKSLLK